MNTWAPIWSGIVDSSLWDEQDHVVKVFLTMLALKDEDHIVRLNAYQIGRNSRKSEAEVLEAINVLSNPDKKRLEKQEFDGRRIERVEDGWLVLNGAKYRGMVAAEMKKARDRRSQANFRAKQAGKPLPYPNQRGSGRKPRKLNEQEQALLDAAHADQCAAMKHLDGVQRGIEEASDQPAAVVPQESVSLPAARRPGK